MASSVQLPCGPCGYDDIPKVAKSWCSNCEEGLCEDCENAHRKNKITRNHKCISISDYHKIENVSISQVCEHHGENLEWFCKTHDKPLCMVCVPTNHRSCDDVISISIAAKNASQSTALSDLVQSIDGTLSNIKQCIANRNSATKEIEKQELEIKEMILQMRKKVNTILDKLQAKLLIELGSTSRSCTSEYAKILQKLNSAEENLTKLREQTLHIKQFSSDIQVFLGTYQGHESIVSETKSIKDAINASKDYQLKVDFNSLMTKLSKEVQDIGQIKVTENISQLDFKDLQVNQAQINIHLPTSSSIFNRRLHLIKTFIVSSQKKNTNIEIPGCVIFPNGHLLISNFASKSLIEYSDAGEHIRDIPVSRSPYGIAVICPNRVVVTYADANFLEIMNNNTFKLEKKIAVPGGCWGVSCENDRLFVVGGTSLILVMDLSGRRLDTLKTASNNVVNITASRERIFYTDYDEGLVHCCLFNGEKLWQFKSTFIDRPRGVAVDNDNNVYVVGFVSNNLSIIQHDGKKSKILLKQFDGMVNPRVVFYSKENRTILICNKEGMAFLYKVEIIKSRWC